MDKGKFAVYRTIDVNVTDIIDRLGKGVTGSKHPVPNLHPQCTQNKYDYCIEIGAEENHHDLWHEIPGSFIGSTPTQIIHHHRTHCKSLNQSLLVIADRQDLAAEGLLIINLDFKGSTDALRQKVFFAGDFVPSVNVGNTTWEETLSNATLPLYPRRRFAVFADRGFHPRYQMTEVVKRMNAGLGNRRAETGTIFANWESAPGDDVGEIVDFWRENAREREWDDRYFVLVRKDAWDHGKAVMISVEDGKDETHEMMIDVERIGEVLVRLFVGFVTLEEVKETSMDGGGAVL